MLSRNLCETITSRCSYFVVVSLFLEFEMHQRKITIFLCFLFDIHFIFFSVIFVMFELKLRTNKISCFFFGECEWKKKQNPVFKLFKLSVDIQEVFKWVYTTKNWIGRRKIQEQTYRTPAQRRLICKGDENENNARICLNSRTENHLKNLEF